MINFWLIISLRCVVTSSACGWENFRLILALPQTFLSQYLIFLSVITRLWTLEKPTARRDIDQWKFHCLRLSYLIFRLMRRISSDFQDFHRHFLISGEDAHAFLSRSQNVDLTTNGSPFEIVKADPDNDLITHQDLERSEKGLPLQSYDAFVIYDDKDVEFATELVEKCESKGYSLCVKDRDLLGGLSFESEAILNILSKRCNRLIIIVSKAFLESPMQRFIINFAQALGIEQGKRKIIPCLIEECHLPQMLRFCFRLDYYRNNKLFDFWDKLDKSLKASTERRSISER